MSEYKRAPLVGERRLASERGIAPPSAEELFIVMKCQRGGGVSKGRDEETKKRELRREGRYVRRVFRIEG